MFLLWFFCDTFWFTFISGLLYQLHYILKIYDIKKEFKPEIFCSIS